MLYAKSLPPSSFEFVRQADVDISGHEGASTSAALREIHRMHPAPTKTMSAA